LRWLSWYLLLSPPCIQVRVVCLGFPFLQEQILPQIATKSQAGPATYSNSSSPTSGPTAAVTPVCCFAVQDTVSEEWWEITSLSTSHYVAANVTSILTYYTIYPDSTSTRFENVTSHNISTSTVYTNLIGQNPIELFPNGGHGPNETANRLNGTAIVTGGIPV
jgi:hypothetical protein